MNMPPTQSEGGGLTDIYRDEGTVRKTAYAVMAAPGQVKLVDRFGRYHHAADWKRIVPNKVQDRERSSQLRKAPRIRDFIMGYVSSI
nr:MAG: hypothetical protein [Bacteriophage sp.]